MVAWFAFGLSALILLSGCTRLPPGSQQPSGTSQVSETTSLEAIVAPLQKTGDLANCRLVLQQVNAHRAASPDGSLHRLADKDIAFLRQSLRLTDEELHEIASASFTLLDAHHLEQCFVLHDAARSLEVDNASAEVRAATAFAWVMRQVQFGDDEELVPPLAVLRRGWGTGSQRALVFLAMLGQLDVPGCVIALPGPGGFGVVGALAGGQLLLFDTRLGTPLPGADGRGIATLAQLRSRPDLLRPLEALGYDVTAAQARTAEPHLIGSLSALAPRMKLLEAGLGPASRVRLGCDFQGMIRAFKDAMAGPAFEGATVRFGSSADDPLAPVRLLRSFLLPDEGGGDDTRWRQRRYELTLTPWDALPQSIRDVPDSIDPGRWLRTAFEQRFVELIQKPGQPRDLLLHGRLGDSVTRLVEVREEVQRYQSILRDEPGLDKELTVWCAESHRLHGDLLVARRKAATAKDGPGQAALEEAERRMAALWKTWPRIRQAVLGAAASPLSGEITYFLALAKHEQAELAQARLDRHSDRAAGLDAAARDAWQSAAERWQRFLDDPVAAWPVPGAALGRARALAAMGQREAAVILLESAAAKQRGWNQKSLRYAAEQLKSR